MKILVDIDIPFVKGVLEPFFDVEYIKGVDFTKEKVATADALIIRTRTKCNSDLLDKSNVKIIATATIGLDHIDREYCNKNNIKVVSSAGCNSGGVLQYVYTALYYLAHINNIKMPITESGKKLTIGVIGVGNVGTKIADFGEYLGFNVLRNDPIKEKEQTLNFNNGKIELSEFKDYYSLEYLLENSDIVSIHVYLDEITRGFVDNKFISLMKTNSILINSSRGEVVNDEILVGKLDKFVAIILDVWNNEPNINPTLLNESFISTPHIAGYSYEGKVNGTQMAIRQIADFFDIIPLLGYYVPQEEINNNYFDFQNMSQKEICDAFLRIFPIFEDSRALKSNPANFESLRNNYNYRREFYVKPRTSKTS